MSDPRPGHYQFCLLSQLLVCVCLGVSMRVNVVCLFVSKAKNGINVFRDGLGLFSVLS